MTEVILDTNALIMPFQFSINLDDEIQRLFGDPEIYVPSSVMEELRSLNKKGPIALGKKYRTFDVKNKGDDGVLEAAEKLDGVIVTNDMGLKKRALDRRIPVGFLRSRSHLELEGEDFLFTKKKIDIDEKESVEFTGEVVSGVGEARYFLALEGYKKRFKEIFGFEPFEGTLNIKLEGGSLEKFNELKGKNGILVEGFVEKGKKFGSVECFPSKIEGADSLIVLPEKTRYDDQVEIVAEEKLRDELGLSDGDEVEITVSVP